MKILLINAIDERDERNAPHLGLCYLAGYARKHGGYNNIKIIETNIESTIRNFKPDIVGLTSVSQNFTIAADAARVAKEVGAIVIVGGVQITLMPNSLDRNMDVGVISEGEQAFLEILQLIEKNGLDKEKLKEIKGIVYWDGEGKLKYGGHRELIGPIDEMPYPARDLVEGFDWKIATMFTSRGCPYNCVFCSSTRIWEKVRYHSPEYVLNEIKYLIDTYGTKHITFNDDLFIANPKRAIEIAELVHKEGGLNGEITFNMSCRANLVNDAVAKALNKMGTELVSMGLETGSPTVINYAKGPAISIQNNHDAINALKDNGVNVHGTFIIGFPVDTRETILETLNFIKKSRLDSFEVYILAPMPGTPIWDYALQRGVVTNEDFDWNRIAHRNTYDFMEKIVLAENLTKQELFELYNMFTFEKKKRKAMHLMKNAIHHPYRVPIYIRNKLLPKPIAVSVSIH